MAYQIPAAFTNRVKSVSNMYYRRFLHTKRAYELQHCTSMRTGKLDTKKLHSYKYNDELFKNKLVLPNGKSHYVCIMIDRSGSMMGSRFKQAMIDATSLAMFCRKAGISHSVMTYTTRHGSLSRGSIAIQLVELFSSSQTELEFKHSFRVAAAMSGAGYMPGGYPELYSGGTPTDTAVLAANSIMGNFIRSHKPQYSTFLLLTDGQVYAPHKSNIMIDEATNEAFEVKQRDGYGEYAHSGMTAVLNKMRAKGIHTSQVTYGARVPSDVVSGLHHRAWNGPSIPSIPVKTDRWGFVVAKDLAGFDEVFGTIAHPSRNNRIQPDDFDEDSTSSKYDEVADKMLEASAKKSTESMTKHIVDSICKSYKIR